MNSDVRFGGSPLWRQRPSSGCSANGEEYLILYPFLVHPLHMSIPSKARDFYFSITFMSESDNKIKIIWIDKADYTLEEKRKEREIRERQTNE